MLESLRTWFLRLRFNFYPAYRGTGARVVHISSDLRTIRIALPLNWRTRNIYGSLFGGSLYAATDPLYAILVKAGLGKNYIVWDKVATIRYLKPGRTTLYAECTVSVAELEQLRVRLEHEDSVDLEREIELMDENGLAHAVVRKTIFIARKEVYYRRQREQANRE